jgi:hypothetical protein
MTIHTTELDGRSRNPVDVAYDIQALAGVIAGAADNIQSGNLTETAVARLAGDIRRVAALIETLVVDVTGKLGV